MKTLFIPLLICHLKNRPFSYWVYLYHMNRGLIFISNPYCIKSEYQTEWMSSIQMEKPHDLTDHSNTRPFDNQAQINTRLVQYSDGYCASVSRIAKFVIFKCSKPEVIRYRDLNQSGPGHRCQINSLKLFNCVTVSKVSTMEVGQKKRQIAKILILLSCFFTGWPMNWPC